MPLISWDTRLETGDATIDGQHRAILETINRLHAAMKLGQGRQELTATVRALEAHFSQHFGMEEALMAQAGLASRAQHRADHSVILEQIIALQERHSQGQDTLVLPYIDFLNDYFVDHILTLDLQMAQALKDHRTSRSAP
jgi:hemerythrin-like metal-binding protein